MLYDMFYKSLQSMSYETFILEILTSSDLCHIYSKSSDIQWFTSRLFLKSWHLMINDTFILENPTSSYL